MPVVVATVAVGTIVPIVILTLTRLLDSRKEGKKLRDGVRANLTNLKRNLGFMHSVVEQLVSNHKAADHTLWIEGVQVLAENIHDSLERFEALKKTSSKEFAKKILEHKTVADDLHDETPQTGTSEGAQIQTLVTMEVAVREVHRFLAPEQEMKTKVMSVVGFGGQGNSILTKQVYNHADVCPEFPLRVKIHAAGLDAPSIREKLQQEIRNNSVGAIRYLIVIENVKAEEFGGIMSGMPWNDIVDGRMIVTTTIQLNPTNCLCGNGQGQTQAGTGPFLIQELTGTTYLDACVDFGPKVIRKVQEAISYRNCLLYFGMFRQDHHVRRDPLLRRWLAEGLVTPTIHGQYQTDLPSHARSGNEDVTFSQLLESEIIQPIQESNDGNAKTCELPGLILDRISGQCSIQNFITCVCARTDAPENRDCVRRLSIHAKCNEGGNQLVLHLPDDLTRLHTLAVFPAASNAHGKADVMLASKLKDRKYSQLLRVLDLKECTGFEQGDFDTICKKAKLLLLKYLSFGGTVDVVPKEIKKLELLETLDLERNRIVTIVCKEVVKLPKLKHLLGKFRLDKTSVKGMKILQKSMAKSKILTLSGFVIDDDMQGFAQLMIHMKMLNKVKIWCLPAASATNKEDVKKAIKQFMSVPENRLHRSLSVYFKGWSKPVLESLHEEGHPKENIRPGVSNESLQEPIDFITVKLRGKLDEFPRFDARGIVELCLSWTKLAGYKIESCLRCMPGGLKYLKLVEKELKDFTIRKEDFKNLERLCLVGVECLQDIKIENLDKLASLHLLSEYPRGPVNIQYGSFNNGQNRDPLGGPCGPVGTVSGIFPVLEELALHHGVKDEVATKWKNALKGHPNKPRFFQCNTPLRNGLSALGDQ